MILRAIKGLEKHSDLRYSLQEQYLYILLDEYQDTNEAQAHLVELLTDNPINEGRPNVMAVGDDDQAIYAFQGANYSHMLNFYNHYRDTLVVPLTANYRSHQDILTLARGVVEQIENRLHHNFALIDKRLEARAKDLPERATTQRDEFHSDLSHYTWVAKQIAELVSKGLPASQIAVLAPKHEYLEALVPFLHHEKLPVHYEKRENVLDDPAVKELATMSQLVLALNGNHRAEVGSLWPEVLSYSFWGLATEELWRFSWQAADNHESWTDVLLNEPTTKPIALFFIRLSQLTKAESMEQLLDYLIGTEPLEISSQETWRSPFYDHYFKPLVNQAGPIAGLWQLLSNLTVVREHLREYKPEASALKLNDFVEFIDAHTAANIKILNTNPHQEALEAVELMTAYKAKGQEFMAVFILAVSDEVWGSKARNSSSRLSLPENLRFMRYSGATDDERLRLLYVAMSRAKTKLYLTSYLSSYTGRPTTRLKYLDEHMDGNDELISPLLPPSEQKIKLLESEPPKIDELTVYWQNRHYEAAEQPELKALLSARLERFQLSPTELNSFTDVTRDGPTSFFTRSLLRFPVAPTPASLYGSTMHETLEWLPQYLKEQSKLPTTQKTIDFFERRLATKRLGEPQASLLKQRGRESLMVYLAQRTDTIKASYLTEYNFRNEAVFIGQAHLSGKIDKLIIDRKNKLITIVDYKTGKSYKHWAREVKMHAFRQQLYCYKLLVEHSRSFKGYKVKDAYLEFVEPDDNGNISELHIDFDADQLKHTEQLIEAVWRLVQELKLPDITGYSKDLKGLEQFEQDLINGLFN
ncbi:MAG TPA: ATP-dependent DNA helicase, partial [Candidatus Binatia bacterium]|nr:ATP-dependent DNA helicase [Candidatus Binatia bacterium]